MNPIAQLKALRSLCAIAVAFPTIGHAQKLVNNNDGHSVFLDGYGAILGGFRYGGKLQYPGAAQTSFGITGQNPTGDYSVAADRPGFATSPSTAFLAGTTTVKSFWVGVFALGPSGSDLSVTPPIEFEPFLRVVTNGVSWDSGTASWHVTVDTTATGAMTADAFDGGQVLLTNDSEHGYPARVGTIVSNGTGDFYIKDPQGGSNTTQRIFAYDYVLPPPSVSLPYGCLGSLRIDYDDSGDYSPAYSWMNFVSDGKGHIQSDVDGSTGTLAYNGGAYGTVELAANNASPIAWGKVSPIAIGVRLEATVMSDGSNSGAMYLALDYPATGPLVHLTSVVSTTGTQASSMTEYVFGQKKQVYYQMNGSAASPTGQLGIYGWSE